MVVVRGGGGRGQTERERGLARRRGVPSPPTKSPHPTPRWQGQVLSWRAAGFNGALARPNRPGRRAEDDSGGGALMRETHFFAPAHTPRVPRASLGAQLTDGTPGRSPGRGGCRREEWRRERGVSPVRETQRRAAPISSGPPGGAVGARQPRQTLVRPAASPLQRRQSVWRWIACHPGRSGGCEEGVTGVRGGPAPSPSAPARALDRGAAAAARGGGLAPRRSGTLPPLPRPDCARLAPLTGRCTLPYRGVVLPMAACGVCVCVCARANE
jgi:hypothetical protein